MRWHNRVFKKEKYMINLVFKNIKNSLSGYKRIYIVMIVSQLITSIILFLMYGIFGSYNLEKREYEVADLLLFARCDDAKMGDLKPYLPELLESLQIRMESFGVNGYAGDYDISIRENYKDGNHDIAEMHLDKGLMEGRWISNKEINGGDSVAISYKSGECGKTVEIAGKTFNVVGVFRDKTALNHTTADNILYIPLKSCPDDVELDFVACEFKRLPTQNDYDTFVRIMTEALGDNYYMSPFEIKDEEEIISIRSIIVMSVVIGIVAALDTALLYGYIMKKRKRQMVIFGINGAKRIQRILINEIEVFIVSAITIGIGFLLFRFFFESVINDIYENSVGIYTDKAYAMMIGIYMLIIVGVTTVMSIAKSQKKLLDVRREC